MGFLQTLWTTFVTHPWEWLLPLGLTIILTAPAVRYVRVGFNIKRDDIVNALSDEARKLYLVKFLREPETTPTNVAAENFKKMYASRFGQRFFIVPLIIITIVTFVEAYLVSENVLADMKAIEEPTAKLSLIAISSIAGAYLWVVTDFVSRSRRLDFSPADIHWAALRLTVAAALGFSFASILADNLGAFIAFSLGAFPLEGLQTLMRRIASKKFEIDLGPTESASQIMKLQGVDLTISERLAQQDLNTILQLSWCDPIQVTMRSNLSFSFVVDLASQALAWIYLEDQLEKLRPLGLRGAYEIRSLLVAQGLAGTTEQKALYAPRHAAAEATLAAAAVVLGTETSKLLFPLSQIADDPYTEFIHSAWN